MSLDELVAAGDFDAFGQVTVGDVLRRFEPTSRAKYVAFTTLADPRQMPGLVYRSIDWPYREGLRIDEAMHPLTLLATGMYGRDLPNQNGAPLRLVVPWKYGFKSAKSLVKIRLVEQLPKTSWNLAAPREYGFYSNVNPEVAHPRWSQANERRLGEPGGLFAISASLAVRTCRRRYRNSTRSPPRSRNCAATCMHWPCCRVFPAALRASAGGPWQ